VERKEVERKEVERKKYQDIQGQMMISLRLETSGFGYRLVGR
jgi:hypothetical protein